MTSVDRTTVDASSATQAATTPAEERQHSLLDLMSDGFYMLLLIQQGQVPTDMTAFADSVRQFLTVMERSALREDIANEDIHAAKYAFCTMVDEIVLSSPCDFREEWSRNPLQLALFGDHLGGQNFFVRLEELRAQGQPRLASLEVYHYCLLLGFQGKYRIEGGEELGYITARLGDEIVYLKGKRTEFAPHWKRPDKISHALRRTVPVWGIACILSVVCLLGYSALRYSLATQTHNQLSVYQQVIKMPAKTANITITLP